MKGGSDHAVTEAMPHKHLDLLHLLSPEVTGVRLEAVNSPRRAWRNTDTIAPWNLSCKWILTDDLNAKHLLCESAVPNTPDEKLVHLFDKNCSDISALTCPTYNSLSRRGYVFEILFNYKYTSVRCRGLWQPRSDQLAIIFHILDPVPVRHYSSCIAKFTDCGRFQCFSSELI